MNEELMARKAAKWARNRLRTTGQRWDKNPNIKNAEAMIEAWRKAEFELKNLKRVLGMEYL